MMAGPSFFQRHCALGDMVAFVIRPSANHKAGAARRKKLAARHGDLADLYEEAAREAARTPDCIRGYEIRADEIASARMGWKTLEQHREEEIAALRPEMAN